jgi:hypothetical protein
LGCEGELGGVLFFVGEPLIDALGETEFGERTIDESFEIGGEGIPVEGHRLIFGDRGDGLSLHEFPLHSVDRGEFVVVTTEQCNFLFDSE